MRYFLSVSQGNYNRPVHVSIQPRLPPPDGATSSNAPFSAQNTNQNNPVDGRLDLGYGWGSKTNNGAALLRSLK